MRSAIFASMALTLWRDRAAFALTFVLPPLIYLIFAAVFSSSASGEISVRLGVVAPDDDISQEIVEGLQQSDLVTTLIRAENTNALNENVQSGAIDAGIHIIRTESTEPPDFQIIYDAAKASAATIAEAALAAQKPVDEDDTDNFKAERIVVSRLAGGAPMAAYYAAGVGMLFVFLSGFQGALSVIEERDSGVMERIAAGPFGLRPMVDGKFAFLTVQGALQLSVIFATAWLAFGVAPTLAPIKLFIAIIAAAICAAGVCLAIVGLCRSRSQAHALGSVVALVLGALGGSMAPRYLMPENIQSIGALTPNAWGIDAFSAVLWRGGENSLFWPPTLSLVVAGFAGLMIAHAAMRHSMKVP